MHLLQIGSKPKISPKGLDQHFSALGFVPNLTKASDYLMVACPDIILIMPDISTLPILSFVREMRLARQTLPIAVMRSNLSDMDNDMEAIFDAGADDCFTDSRENALRARLRAIWRRHRGQSSNLHKVANLTINTDTRDIWDSHGQCIRLTPKPYQLMMTLLARPGSVFSREHLLTRCYEKSEEIEDRSIDNLIKKVRQSLSKLETSISIETLYGAGYRLLID